MPLNIFLSKKMTCTEYIIHREVFIQNDSVSFSFFFNYHTQTADYVWPVGTILSILFSECLKPACCFLFLFPVIIATSSIWPVGSHRLSTFFFFNLLTAVLRFILILSNLLRRGQEKNQKVQHTAFCSPIYLAEGKQCGLVNLVISLKPVH